MCIAPPGRVFDDNLPAVPTSASKCKAKNYTLDAALGDGAVAAVQGHRNVYLWNGARELAEGAGVGAGEDVTAPLPGGLFRLALDVSDVAVAGNIAVTGILGERTVHTFVKDETTGAWAQEEGVWVAPPNGAYINEEGDAEGFGTALGLDGDVLAVGARDCEDAHLDANLPPPAARGLVLAR